MVEVQNNSVTEHTIDKNQTELVQPMGTVLSSE